MAGKIRVLIVDDSAFMRKVISDILNSDDEMEVADTAKNGQEALEKAMTVNPDVVTLDVEMPVLDGLGCLKELLKKVNIPVVMLSSVTQKGAAATIQALEYGAVDFIGKPGNIFEMNSNEKKQEIIEKVKIAAKASSVKKLITRQVQKKSKNDIIKSVEIKKVVAIGTSTGGPKALQDVIPLIRGNIPAAFLVVQHMPPGFTRSLAERLNSMSELTVKEAEDNDILMPGYVYIAPGDYHMLVHKNKDNSLKIKLSHDPPVGAHRPSVNVMMNSLSDTGITNVMGVIMTGMGGDGSEGIVNLKKANNAYIIAQDEKTCVVYGMPRVAFETGMVDSVVPLNEIAKEIMKIVGVYE